MRSAQVALAVAKRLAEAGAGTWREDGVFTSGQTAITLKGLPPSPDRAIAITVYNVDEDPSPESVTQTWSVQVRTRAATGRADAVDDLADDAHDALETHRAQWPGTFIQRSHRHNFAPLGPDANRRHERVDNYRIITAR